jgi:hypothetical protein
MIQKHAKFCGKKNNEHFQETVSSSMFLENNVLSNTINVHE